MTRWIRSKGALTAVLSFWLMGAAACGGTREDPILVLSSEESLAIGKDLMANEKYRQAEKYLAHAFEASPNSASGREALLLSADALFLHRGIGSLIKAESKYRDFLNRFPTSDRIPYVQLQIGKCLAARVEKPDRDQSVTLQAVQAFEDLVRLYPTSEEAILAQEQLDVLAGRLAEHEFQVGFFYYRYGIALATISRLEHLVEHYPQYAEMDKVYYYLAMANGRRANEEEASTWFQRLRDDYPDSEWVRKIPTSEERGTPSPEAEAEGEAVPADTDPTEGASSASSS